MPPPTVNGTKTFSEVYLNTYDSKHIQIKEQNQHVTFEVKTKVLVSQQNINIGYLLPFAILQTCSIGKSPRGKSLKPVIFKKLTCNLILTVDLEYSCQVIKHKHSILSKAYLISSIIVILSSKLNWLAKVSYLQKFMMV
jgi:hypothetical protein